MNYILFIIVVAGLVLSIGLIIAGHKEIIKEDKLLKKREEEKRRQEEEHLVSLVKQYGAITKKIEYGAIYDKKLYVFESSAILLVEDKPIRFCDIIGFEVSDMSSVIYSGQVAKSSTDTGSMLGRAVICGIVGGGLGAIVGGSTASKNTKLSSQKAFTKHDYKVCITLNDLANPVVMLDIGSDPRDAHNEIIGILSIIVKRNSHR